MASGSLKGQKENLRKYKSEESFSPSSSHRSGVSSTNGAAKKPRMNIKLGSIGPDGLPHLPPIAKPQQRADPHAKSRLMTFRLADHNQALLMNILQKDAERAYEETRDYNKKQPLPEIPGAPSMPAEVNYQFMRKCVESGPVVPMQKEWFEHIMMLVPEHLRTAAHLKDNIFKLYDEVTADYESSIKKSMVQHVLVKPDVRGLEGDQTGPPPSELEGLDYSQPWHEDFLAAREMIRENLHILHPSHQTVLQMCHAALNGLILVDCSTYRSLGPVEFDNLKNNVILDKEKVEEKLMHSWFPGIINVFANKNNFSNIKGDKLTSFYNSVTTLISNQLRNLLIHTMDTWVNQLQPENRDKIPILKMELTFDDQKMQFYPPYEDLEETILFVVEQITKTLQQVPTVQSWLSGGNTVMYTDIPIPDHLLQTAIRSLKDSVSRIFEPLATHLQSFKDKYDWVVNGQAMEQIQKFMKEEHDFKEYCEYIESFRNLAREIMGLPSIEHFDLIRLDCEDLKRGLAEAARGKADVLLTQVSTNHRNENKQICKEFKTIMERAEKTPETSEELIEMMHFVENARSGGMIKLNDKIEQVQMRLAYLIDVYMFSPEDIDLNCQVLTWPQKINPIFDRNEELVEASKLKGEKALLEKREKVLLELDRLRHRVDEFNDCGELDMMHQYVQDIRAVQKRLVEVQDSITWINKEEALYKVPINQYNDVEEITAMLDPFQRLFTVVVKWQKAEKRWMDGAFLELNAEAVEGEVDEYIRDLYKVQKVFNQKWKKMQMERDELERKKKKVPTATLR